MTTLTHYHKCIRKITAAFASLFNNIILIRENIDGTENQRLIVPLEFGDKEKYIKRLQGDPNLDKKTQITLPRMSYELTGFSYDAGRKLNTNGKNFATNPSSPDSIFYSFNPVPYDFDFSLTIYTRNIEDGNQIVEQILPYFTPDYTMKINLVPEMGIIRNVPIILNATQTTIDSDGLFNTEARTIFWTLNFTAKGFIFGTAKDGSSGIIKHENINIKETKSSENISFDLNFYNEGSGGYKIGELVYQGMNLDNSYSRGFVQNWSNNTLSISNMVGNFKVEQTVIGSESLSIYKLKSISNTGVNVSINSSVYPPEANSNSNWTANTTIIEY